MKTLSPVSPTACNRREALALLAAGAGVVACGADLALAAPVPGHCQPVSAYFLDGLVRDTSGKLPAYRPPGGYAGGQGIGQLDDLGLRMTGIQF